MDANLLNLYKKSIPEDSIVVNENADTLEIKFKIQSIDDWTRWKSTFEAASNIKWILRKSQPLSKLFWLSKNYVCQHSSWNKKKQSKRGCDCNASMSIRAKTTNQRVSQYFI